MVKTYKDIQGWFDWEPLYEQIVNYMPAHRESNLLEIGTWRGKSTGFLATKIMESGKHANLWAVDTFLGENTCVWQAEEVRKAGGSIYDEFIQNMTDLGVYPGIVQPIKSLSLECLDKIPVKEFEMIFIDSDHNYDGIMKDLEYFWPHVKKGGVIAGHDFQHPQCDVARAVKDFFEPKGTEIKIYNISWFGLKT